MDDRDYNYVKLYSNWCEKDTLDDKEFTENELGTKSRHNVTVVKYYTDVNDHGFSQGIPHSEAFIHFNHNDALIKARLIDCLCRVKRVLD